MAEEEGKKPEAGEAAKEVVKDFVQTLGLLDIILGGLALYWVRLSLAGSSAHLFPSTNHEILDIALLICAASVLGKAVWLAVASLTALFWMILSVLDVFGYRSRLENVLDIAVAKSSHLSISPEDYRKKPQKIRTEELAASLVTADDASNKQAVERLHTNITFSYSLMLLLILYSAHFSHPGTLVLAGWLKCGVGLFLILGILYQFDLARTLGTFLMVQGQPQEQSIKKAETK